MPISLVAVDPRKPFTGYPAVLRNQYIICMMSMRLLLNSQLPKQLQSRKPCQSFQLLVHVCVQAVGLLNDPSTLWAGSIDLRWRVGTSLQVFAFLHTTLVLTQSNFANSAGIPCAKPAAKPQNLNRTAGRPCLKMFPISHVFSRVFWRQRAFIPTIPKGLGLGLRARLVHAWVEKGSFIGTWKPECASPVMTCGANFAKASH